MSSFVIYERLNWRANTLYFFTWLLKISTEIPDNSGDVHVWCSTERRFYSGVISEAVVCGVGVFNLIFTKKYYKNQQKKVQTRDSRIQTKINE